MLTLNSLRTQFSHTVSNQTLNFTVLSFYKGKDEAIEAIAHLRVEVYSMLPQKHQDSQF